MQEDKRSFVSYVRLEDFKGYPKVFPFNPGEAYPEYKSIVGTTNPVYDAVRRSLHSLERV